MRTVSLFRLYVESETVNAPPFFGLGFILLDLRLERRGLGICERLLINVPKLRPSSWSASTAAGSGGSQMQNRQALRDYTGAAFA